MSNFFSELNNTIGKVKYQEFNITLFEEQFTVHIPYSLKQEFFEAINTNIPSTKKDIELIVKKFSGKLG
jgi:hypothetical protein